MATKLDADWISRFTLSWRSNQFTEAKGHLYVFWGRGRRGISGLISLSREGEVRYLGVGHPDKGAYPPPPPKGVEATSTVDTHPTGMLV